MIAPASVRPLISALFPALAIAMATSSHAQSWETMREVVFDSSVFSSTGTAEDREILKTVWATELSAPRLGSAGKRMPAFALLGDTATAEGKVIFSMFAAAGNTLCLDAPNGTAAMDIYSVCTMRIIAWPPRPGLRAIELPGYCMLYANTDRSQNRVEYRIEQTQPALTIRFRAWQFGKVIPACNRAMRLS